MRSLFYLFTFIFTISNVSASGLRYADAFASILEAKGKENKCFADSAVLYRELADRLVNLQAFIRDYAFKDVPDLTVDYVLKNFERVYYDLDAEWRIEFKNYYVGMKNHFPGRTPDEYTEDDYSKVDSLNAPISRLVDYGNAAGSFLHHNLNGIYYVLKGYSHQFRFDKEEVVNFLLNDPNNNGGQLPLEKDNNRIDHLLTQIQDICNKSKDMVSPSPVKVGAKMSHSGQGSSSLPGMVIDAFMNKRNVFIDDYLGEKSTKNLKIYNSLIIENKGHSFPGNGLSSIPY